MFVVILIIVVVGLLEMPPLTRVALSLAMATSREEEDEDEDDIDAIAVLDKWRTRRTMTKMTSADAINAANEMTTNDDNCHRRCAHPPTHQVGALPLDTK